MNRNILIAAIIVVLAALGYYQFSVVPAQRAAEQAAAKQAEEKAAADAKAAEEAAAAEAKAAEEAAAKAAEEAAAKAAEQAAAAAKAATDAATKATDAATKATDAATKAAAQIWDATKLTPEEIAQRIAEAPIPQSVKDTLAATYTSVKDNPAAVQMVLDQLKQAMGL
jgi:hypothetical protein